MQLKTRIEDSRPAKESPQRKQKTGPTNSVCLSSVASRARRRVGVLWGMRVLGRTTVRPFSRRSFPRTRSPHGSAEGVVSGWCVGSAYRSHVERMPSRAKDSTGAGVSTVSSRRASSRSHATTRYELDANSSPASTCSTSAASTGSSSDASRAKPECNLSNSRSEIESRSTPSTRSSARGRCNHRKRISAARGSVTAFSRSPRSISASEGARSYGALRAAVGARARDSELRGGATLALDRRSIE
jgi:hypothetical protein